MAAREKISIVVFFVLMISMIIHVVTDTVIRIKIVEELSDHCKKIQGLMLEKTCVTRDFKKISLARDGFLSWTYIAEK